jgi:hypothetical protein
VRARRRTPPRLLAPDVMRPSGLRGPPAPSAADRRRWLRVVLQALVVLANLVAAAVLLGVALR